MSAHQRLAILVFFFVAFPSARGEPPLTDRYGDPLPLGAVARFGTVRFRAGGEVNSVAISLDGKLIAATTVWNGFVWDVTTGQEVVRFKNKFRADAVAFASDGKTLISANSDGLIQHWDVASGTLSRQTKPDERDRFHASSVRFSPDLKLLTLAAYGDQLRLVDVADGKPILRLEKPFGVPSTAVSPDGKTLATGGQDKILRLWDVATGRMIREMEGHTNLVVCVEYSPDGKTLVSSEASRSRLWDTASGKLLRELPNGGGTLAFSPDGKTLASGFNDTIRLWEVATGRELRQLKGHGSWIIPTLAFSADGKRLVSGSRDSTVIVWNVATGEPIHHFDGHRGEVLCLAFSPDDQRLASGGSEDGTLLLWDVATMKLLHRCPGHDPWVLCAAFSPDGKTIVSGEGSNGTGDTECQIRYWDAATGRLTREFFGHLNSVQSLAFSPDGRTLASSGWDARVRLWDAASAKRLRQIRGPDTQKALAFSPDGKSLLVADTFRGGLTLFAAENATQIRTFGETSNQVVRNVVCAAFHPNGKTLTSVESRREVRGDEVTEARIWDAGSGRMLRSFVLSSGPSGMPPVFALAPDGKTLAAGEVSYGGDSAVVLWDMEAAKPLGTLRGHTGAITALAFSHDGRYLASGSWDATVLLWDVRQTRLLGIWSRLGSKSEEAAEAAKSLAASLDGVVPFLRQRLRQARESETKYARLIADLDNDSFEVREAASQQLQRAGAAAEMALRLALHGEPSAELRKRVEELLNRLTAPRTTDASFAAAALRAPGVLETIGTAEARRTLEELAEGPAGSRIVREARAALERLKNRDKDR